MSKRKSVRFMEDPSPSDKALLKLSKRRRDENRDDETTDEGAYGDIGRKLEPRPGEKQEGADSKHTLDSDEEEDEKYERLNVADVEGQEDATLEFDDETKITPFNMNEEMDEGHFDSDGTFIFDKNKEEIRDAWLDNIDWAKIKKDAGDQWQGETGDPNDPESSRSPIPVDRSDIYESILAFLQPQETITKALKRLGGSRTTADVRQARWKEKKISKASEEKTKDNNADVDEKTTTSASTSAALPSDERSMAVTKLTELVDNLVDEGEFEIYGYTYEKIKHELEKCRKLKNQQETKADAGDKKGNVDDDSELDMFADEIDDKKLKTETAISEKKEDGEKKQDEAASSDVRWEFKWKNEDAEPVQGPCSSEQMQQWTDEGYFKDGVWVRRIGQEDALFYNSKRIDFELYI